MPTGSHLVPPKRVRLLTIAGGAIAALLALGAACAFPDPALVPDRVDDVPEGGSDAPVAVPPPDAEPPISDGGADAPSLDANCDPCDCDGDGFVADDAVACPDAGGKRRDCNDEDPRFFPDAGYVHEAPPAGQKGDWNCDGTVTRERNVRIDCTKYGGTLSTTCGKTEGFFDDPPCGVSASYVVCKPSGLTDCVQGTVEDRAQGCK